MTYLDHILGCDVIWNLICLLFQVAILLPQFHVLKHSSFPLWSEMASLSLNLHIYLFIYLDHSMGYISLVCLFTYSVQFSSVAQSCPTLCDPIDRSTPGLPVHHQPLEFTETHVHQVSDAIQPSHPLLSPSPPAPNPSQHQSLFQWVNSSHEVAKVLEFQL